MEPSDDAASLICNSLRFTERISTEAFPSTPNLHGAVLSLSSRGVIKYRQCETTKLVLTASGEDALARGSPEFLLLRSITDDGTPAAEVSDASRRYAFKNGWIRMAGGKIYRAVTDAEDVTRIALENVRDGRDVPDEKVKELKRMGLLQVRRAVHYIIERGPKFGSAEEKCAEVMADFSNVGSLREINFSTEGAVPCAGALHPLCKIVADVRDVFVAMGFEEMDTMEYVSLSLWNFDALFIEQNHPARAVEDTFFVDPESVEALNGEDLSGAETREYIRRIERVHEKGGHGSVGYRSKWSEAESRKVILRPHTTGVTAQYLFNMAMTRPFKPAKLFSIDKVFRNESPDATHLLEFNQIEGVVVDRNINICDLLGFLSKFYEELNLGRVKFKPTYNPYTQPSVEVFAMHPEIGWVEVGNSGVFRPEVLRTMGFDRDVRAIAWGLSLERPAMIKYGKRSIRELVGSRVDMKWIRTCDTIPSNLKA